MKIKELIEMLSQLDQDQEIVIASPTGNYWNHVKAEEITGLNEGLSVYSGYLQADQIIDEDKTLVDEEGNDTYYQKGVACYYDNQPVKSVIVIS